MTNFEWMILMWVVILTGWLVFVKRGPKGADGEDGARGSAGEFNPYVELSSYDISRASLGLLDDAKYVTELIKKINSYQLVTGNKVDTPINK